MKKAAFALALLLSLALLSHWNLRHLEELTSGLGRGIESVRQYCREGDFAAAENTLDAVLECWLRSDGYTHVFIRHSEIDAATDIFYDLRSCLLAEDGPGAAAEAEKLLSHLQSIYAMECVSFKSVF